MNNYGDLIPAYGRDYKTAKECKAAFLAGKDFLISSLFHPYSGKPINLPQVQADGVRSVMLRYRGKTMLVSCKVPQASEVK